jgi:hypothetical protein
VTRLSPPEIVAGIQNLALALDSARNLQATFVNQTRVTLTRLVVAIGVRGADRAAQDVEADCMALTDPAAPSSPCTSGASCLCPLRQPGPLVEAEIVWEIRAAFGIVRTP